MAKFNYEALDTGGRTVRGQIDAGSEDMIIEKLRGMGYYPLKVVREKKKVGDVDLLALPGLRNIFHRVKIKHLTVFTRQLATLIDAGLPIMRSLHILEEQVESVVFKEKIGLMAKSIEEGSTLSDAMSKHRKVFDNLFVNMIRAGEIGGVLEVVLNKLADYLEKRQALVSKVRSALMYPMVVLVLATIIVGVILIMIIPKFDDIFSGLGAELPWMTQQLVTASNILQHQFPLVIAGLIILYIIYRQINKTREGKYVFDRVKLKLPVFGSLILKASIARFASTLSTLITAGVPILQAIDIVRDTSGNEVVARAMEKIHSSVKEGESIHEPMREVTVFPPLVVHMVAVGEETGAIDHMLQKVAEAYQRDVDDTVDALTSIMEPLLMVFLGVIIGAIVIALYLPLFTLPSLIPSS
ncbi:type II secretion system F family protein [Candidatus Sumerlaeota bacterium]|nr:type II secretion system F family protein [Candidatus Sumerlaeota bacterium]